MVADTAAVVPGKAFLMGVLFTVDPGWHIYWKNPGDAGIATKVKWDLPAGFSAGEVMYPTPYRIDQTGDIHCFGYENSVLLWARVTAPASLPADFEGEFKANISWLVCADQCYPGKASVRMTLRSSGSAEPANQEIFQQWQTRLPVEAAESADLANWSVSAGPHTAETGQAVVQISWKGATPKDVQFFPEISENYDIDKISVQNDGGGSRITLNWSLVAGKKPVPETLDAVVGYNAGENRRGVSLKIALPDPTPEKQKN